MYFVQIIKCWYWYINILDYYPEYCLWKENTLWFFKTIITQLLKNECNPDRVFHELFETALFKIHVSLQQLENEMYFLWMKTVTTFLHCLYVAVLCVQLYVNFFIIWGGGKKSNHYLTGERKKSAFAPRYDALLRYIAFTLHLKNNKLVLNFFNFCLQ